MASLTTAVRVIDTPKGRAMVLLTPTGGRGPAIEFSARLFLIRRAWLWAAL